MKSSAAADVDLELLKAVAQAWHAQSGNPRPSRAAEKSREEHVGARPRAGAARYRPSRFKLEAMAVTAPAAESPAPSERPWDFTRSLWDTYELVSVARKLESGLVIADYADDAPPAAVGGSRGEGKRGRESRRSLRRLLLRSSSKRIQDGLACSN